MITRTMGILLRLSLFAIWIDEVAAVDYWHCGFSNPTLQSQAFYKHGTQYHNSDFFTRLDSKANMGVKRHLAECYEGESESEYGFFPVVKGRKAQSLPPSNRKRQWFFDESSINPRQRASRRMRRDLFGRFAPEQHDQPDSRLEGFARKHPSKEP